MNRIAICLAIALGASVSLAQDEKPPPDEAPKAEPTKKPAEPDDAKKPAEPAGPKEASKPAKSDEPAPKAPDKPAAAKPAPIETPTLRARIEEFLGNRISGEIDTEYRLRRTSEDTDQDITQYIETRLGDEYTDTFAANVSLRTTADLDGQRENRDGDYDFVSIEDSYGSSVNVRLYTLYGNWRPKGGRVEQVRVGRQFIQVSETFHVDGVFAESREIVKDIELRAAAYAGVPVHLYESSTSGDRIAGLQFTARPWRRTRAALDYVYVTDDLGGRLGKQYDSFVSLAAWQTLHENLRAYARTTYLGTVRDIETRLNAVFPEQDLLLSAAYYRLFEPKKELSTEFDAYFPVLATYEEYQKVDVRAVKGFGDHVVIEGGASVRDLIEGADAGAYNHDTKRFYVSPSVLDLPWKGSSIVATYDRYADGGTRLESLSGEVGHRFDDKFEAALGTAFDLYKPGDRTSGERNRVRSYFLSARFQFSESVTLDSTLTREEDDEETYLVFTFGIQYVF